MRADRLLQLADFIEKVPDHQFDLDVVCRTERGKIRAEKPSIDPACGTAACAIGWCPFVFPDLCEYRIDCVDFSVAPIGKGAPEWDRTFGQVAMWLFDLPRDQATQLFLAGAQKYLPGLTDQDTVYTRTTDHRPHPTNNGRFFAATIRKFVQHNA